MDSSLARSIVKAFRDFGVQAGALLVTALLAISSDTVALSALTKAVPGWLAGLLPVVFLVARVIQDQAKHGGKQPE